MTRHPDGEAQTMRLIELAGLSPCKVLDMGAGSGEAVSLLRALGFDAVGIDKAGKNGVLAGDFLCCPFPDGSFGAVLSECAFFVSGQPEAALKEAFRLLKKGGKLLLSDVAFGSGQELKKSLEAAGFRVLAFLDETAAWKKYYIECIWNGTADLLCGCARGKKCGYYLAVCERT